MNELLSNPAVQAGVAPFVAALAMAVALRRTRLHAAAPLAGLVVLLALSIGFSLEPLTAVKKLLLLTIGAGVVSLALEATETRAGRALQFGLPVLAGFGCLWMLQRVLAQRETADAWRLGGSAFLFVALLVAANLMAPRQTTRASAAGVSLGWGGGALGVLGASALLGQIGIALGTACAALMLVQLVRQQPAPEGATLALMPSVGAALLGVLACTTGELQPQYLLPLLLVPVATRLVPVGTHRPWLNTVGMGLAALIPSAAAVAWAYGASVAVAG